METLCNLYEGFSSSDSAVRQESENQFNNLRQADPNTFLQLTLGILQQQPNSQYRVQAAISLRNLFREFVLTPDNCLWNKITPENQNMCLIALLKCLETEHVNVVSINISDTVSLVAMELYPNGKWPELLPFLFRLISNLQNYLGTSNAPENVVIPARHAFRIIGEIMPVLEDVVATHRDNIVSTISAALQYPDIEIRYEAIGLIAAIVESSGKKNWAPLVYLTPVILEILQNLIATQHVLAIDVLYRLTTISESDPAFYRQHFGIFFSQILAIAQNKQIGTDLRQAAVECLLCVVETRPNMCTKHNNFVNDMITTLLSFMLEFEDDPNWAEIHPEQEENEDNEFESDIEDEDCLYPIGEEGLDRLARALDAEVFIPTFYQFITIYMQQTNAHPWKYRYAAIMAIAQTIEYLPEDEETYQDHMGQIISRIIAFLKDPYPRVRYACCQAIGQIALDHSPLVQELFHATVLPQLIQTIDDPISKVASHALSALVNFTEEVPAEDLQPYVQPLMEKLLNILHKQPQPPRIVREQCITMIAVIAGVIENDFAPYYSTVVPYLKKTMQEASPQLRTLRGKCIECLTIIGFSLDYSIFKNDAQETMVAFIQLMGSGLKGDDPLKEYIQEALQRMCRIMKQDFVPYLPHLLSNIFQLLETREESLANQLLSGSSENSTREDDSKSMNMLTARDFIGLRTTLVLDMESSLDILNTFVEVLGVNYRDYIAKTITVIYPLIRFALSDEIKEKTYDVLSGLLKIMRSLVDTDDTIRNQFGQIVNDLITLFLAILEEENRVGTTESQTVVISGIEQCIDALGTNSMNVDQVGVFTSRCFDMLQQSFLRRKKLDEKVMDEVNNLQSGEIEDEDDKRGIEEEKEQEQEFRLCVLGLLGVFMKYYPNIYWEKVGTITIQLVTQYVNPLQNTIEDRILGFHLSANVFQYLCPLAYPHCTPWLQFILEGINDPIASIQQNCAFSLAQAAKLEHFSAIANNATQVIIHRLQQSKTKGKAFNLARDNIINALGNILFYHSNSLNNIKELFNLWINVLPLKYDTDEAQNTHTTLMNFVDAKNQSVLGSNLENFGRILSIFVEIYNTSMSNENLNNRIKILIVHTNPNNLQPFLSSLTKKQVDKLRKICK
ncbi:HEAT repeat family protein [Cryptosporidium muris RN66]|uniref:HEAT repeat family protein n=1 Tax=Cryptosporidium muris (strain RN66) TaxID=441375 RepID=B6ABW9_CRYMR|nr:HEAT repeat family protein [Cryptosporidium muris RN66]EEA05322.1 HEAT repeat family protein [Cryptosporidium muris RN66]|eukprot:XP_002139671.1 HEAT repeat family protein [Cryptosporidium muris RN66]